MNLQDLEVFMEIATLGGFNRAATHLHVAQSALSRRVARLEYEIGTPLLIRNKQGVQLTPAGAILLERSQSLLRHFDQVEAEIKAEASEPRGEVTLGLPPSLLHSASTLLSTLRSRY
ncbi:MAG TPA: LysR family transcriptional regulator, partial [Acetobacteraceae bacterium]|nr:LysR family transcriptional regulator [Acetobacteraceae bacterium]